MFRQNQRHRQMVLFGTVHRMPVGITKMMDKSWVPAFRKLIFEKIEERRYAKRYSTIESRPNFPVNNLGWAGDHQADGLTIPTRNCRNSSIPEPLNPSGAGSVRNRFQSTHGLCPGAGESG